MMARDAQRFVMRFFEVISDSAASIYSSALLFTPECRLYATYRHKPHASVVVQPGRETGWDPCLLVKRGELLWPSLTFSPDGNRLASGRWNGPIQVWD